MQGLQRPYAALAALLGWFALGLQLHLMFGYAALNGETPLLSILRFFSFFTVVTNTIAAISLSLSAFGRSNFMTRPNTQAAIAVYIFVVSLIYTLLLRNLWNPSGEQRLADTLLHYAMPALYLLYWILFVPKEPLRYSGTIAWLICPAVYVVFALWRGAVTGQYPYPFLDAGRLGYAHIALNIAGLGAVFLGFGLVAVFLGKAIARTGR